MQSNVLLVKNHCFNFLTFLKLPNETNQTNISILFMTFYIITWLIKCSATGKVSNTACGFHHLLRPLIESALLKIMWLKVERSSLQFMNLNLLRTKRNENWTLWRSLFKHYLAGLLIVRWPDQEPSTQNLLWNINYKFGFKIQPVDRLFLQVERTFLARHVHQKFALSAHLIRICVNSKIYPSNLRTQIIEQTSISR